MKSSCASVPIADERQAMLITGYSVLHDFRFYGRERTLDNYGELVEIFDTAEAG